MSTSSGKVWSLSRAGQGCWLLALPPQMALDEAVRLRVVTNDITRARCDKLTLQLVHFILEYVEVVGRCHRNDVVLGMPGSVQDLLIEVQTIHADFILFAFAACAHLAGLQDLHGLAVFTGRLQCHVPSVAAIEHPEEVVI